VVEDRIEIGDLVAMMGFNGYGTSPWMMVFWSLMMFLFVGGLVLLVVWGIKAIGGQRTAQTDIPLDTLKRRFAAGEINQEEFDKTRRSLQG
jgi:putative membrane protein